MKHDIRVCESLSGLGIIFPFFFSNVIKCNFIFLKRGIQGLLINILSHPVSVKITELRTIKVNTVKHIESNSGKSTFTIK